MEVAMFTYEELQLIADALIAYRLYNYEEYEQNKYRRTGNCDLYLSVINSIDDLSTKVFMIKNSLL